MKTYRAAALIVAFGSLAALPGCSMMNMHPFGGQTASAAPMAHPELSPDMVKQVQASLQQQGMYKGNVDGVWGSGTQSAVQSYQGAHNLPATGQLDPETLKSLNLSSNTAAGSTAPASSAPAVSGAPASPPAQAPATTTTQ